MTFVVFLMAAAALLLSALNWWQSNRAEEPEITKALEAIGLLEKHQSEIVADIERVDGVLADLAGSDNAAKIQSVRRELGDNRESLSTLRAAFDEQVAVTRSLQAATETMQARLRAAEAAVSGLSVQGRGADEQLDLAEVDYLLRLAGERLALFADPVAADRALDLADRHLAAIDSPVYLGVRGAIAESRQELSSIEMPDRLAISGRIDGVQTLIPSLVFLADMPAAEESGPDTDESWWGRFTDAMSGLVTVRRSTDGEAQRLTLEDRDLVRQRLWLQLEMVRLALVRDDAEAYGVALELASEGLSSGFDTSAGSGARALEAVEGLAAERILVEMPDISAPWKLLQALRATSVPRPVTEPVSVPVTEPADGEPAAPTEEPADEAGEDGGEEG